VTVCEAIAGAADCDARADPRWRKPRNETIRVRVAWPPVTAFRYRAGGFTVLQQWSPT